MAATATMNDFKKMVMGHQPKVFSPTPMPDPKHLGTFLMTKVIPSMWKKDVAFGWHFVMKDVFVYDADEYRIETNNYKEHNCVKTDGDQTWVYEWKFHGKTRRCIMTTEIWYEEGKDYPLSPVAILFGQMFGNGFHIVKCQWEEV